MSTLEERIAAYETPRCNVLGGFEHDKVVASGLGLLFVGLFILYKDLKAEQWSWKEIGVTFVLVWGVTWGVIKWRVKREVTPTVVKRGIE